MSDSPYRLMSTRSLKKLYKRAIRRYDANMRGEYFALARHHLAHAHAIADELESRS